MVKLVINKLIALVLILIGVSLLSFFFSSISPVDPAEAYAQRTLSRPTAEQIEQIRREMGLDRPFYEQYFSWSAHVLQGDFGTSLLTRTPVSAELPAKFAATLHIVLLSMFFAVLLTVPLSVVSAARKNGIFDQVTRVGTIIGMSLPNFWIGFMLLVLFAVTVPVFKIADYGSFKSLVLPALALSIPMASSAIRVFRSNLIHSYRCDFVTYARSRGLPERRITGMVLKHAMPPMVTIMFQYFGYALAGSAMVEAVFSWPGIGSYLVKAIIGRDLPAINACVLLIAVIFVLANFTAELINLAIHPTMNALREGYRA